MLYRFGRLTVRFRWAIILFWGVLFTLSLPFAPRLAAQLAAGFGEVRTESRIALDILEEEFDAGGSSITLVFSSDSLTVKDPRYVQEMERTLSRFKESPYVKRVITFYNSRNPHMVSPDGTTTYALVLLNLELDEAMDNYPRLKELIEPGELQIWATGGVPIFSDMNEASERDLQRAEMITLPLVLLALVLVFRGLVAAGLPVAMGGVSVATTLAILYFLAQATDVSIFAMNLASLLGLGIAIDYSLLIVSRFREELERRARDEAVAVTIATAGRAILFSGLTSALGLSGLLLFKYMMLRSLGMGGVLVVVVSMLVALTLLPAILSVVGRRIDLLSILRRGPTAREGLWHRLAFWVMRNPILVSVPLMALLLLLGTPFLGVKLGEPWASILPPKAEARQGWELVSEKIGPGELSPILVVARSPTDIRSPRNLDAIYDLAHDLSADERVERVESIATLDPSITREQYHLLLANPSLVPPGLREALNSFMGPTSTVLRVYTSVDPNSEEARGLVRRIRSYEPGGDLKLYVSGATADLMDAIDVMYSDFPKVIIFVVVAIYLVLLLLFRSVVLPLKAVVMNAMSIFASFGALVYIFQEGHFQGLLGFRAEGFTEASLPILIFCIVFGLSMDYEVFLLSRVKEIHDETDDNTLSVAQGLERTGRIITSAAMIMVLVASSFSTGEIVLIKALGVGIAIAVFLDATLVRALLVPALMRILGAWNWWAPGFLKRVLPQWQVPD